MSEQIREAVKKHVRFHINKNFETLMVRRNGFSPTRPNALKLPYALKRNIYNYPLIASFQAYALQENYKKEPFKKSALYSSFPEEIPLWVLEYKEVWEEVKDNLWLYNDSMFSMSVRLDAKEIKKTFNIDVGKHSINIDGKIAAANIILSESDADIKKRLRDQSSLDLLLPVYDIYFGYKNIKYLCSLPFQGVSEKESFIISAGYKKLLKPDGTLSKGILKQFKVNPTYAKALVSQRTFTFNIANLESLYKYGETHNINIRFKTKNNKEVRYIDIDDLMNEPGNDVKINKMLDAERLEKIYFVLYETIYFFNPDALKLYRDQIFDYLSKHDLKTFLDEVNQASGSVSINTSALNRINKNGFIGKLQEHQKLGVSWLANLYEKKIPGALLADEMGMGKTPSTIAFLSTISGIKNKKIIIICPASVISVWENELDKFNPTLASSVGSKIKIMSYESSIRAGISKTDILILDEVQKIKNNKTLTFKAISKIEKEFVVLLSGTPIENSINDLFNILQVVHPSFSDLSLILNRMYRNDEKGLATRLRKVIDPIYLQRKKSKDQLISVLKINPIMIEPTQFEIKLNEEITKVFHDRLIKVNAQNNHDFYSTSVILTGLMRMRQSISYANQIPEDLTVHFSPSTKREIKTALPSKFTRLRKDLKEIKTRGEKVVIFIQFRQTMDFLKKELGSAGYKILTLSGSDTSSKRKTSVQEFQKPGSTYDVFIISLKAGNTGLTLTNANNIIIYDLWFNPAVISQAIARVHRIGQNKDVNALLYITEKTIDRRVYDIFYKKQELSSHFESSAGTGSTNTKEVKEMGSDIFK